MGCVSTRTKVKPKPPPLQIPPEGTPVLFSHNPDSTAISVQTSPNLIRWKRGHLIGQGAYGHVYQALNVDTGQLYALKHLLLSSDPEKRQKEVTSLRREFLTLQELSHENIVKYLQVDVEPDYSGVNIVLEYVPCGSVLTVLKRLKQCEEGMIRNYTAQLLEGLSYLHHRGIIHRDLKCSNVLVDSAGRIKITDFGSSRRVGTDTGAEEPLVCKSLKGSPYWMAPEVARRAGHSYPADIWSVGCTVIEMISRRAPWSDISTNCKEVLSIISATTAPPRYPCRISSECKSFLDNCLQVNPEKRASVDQLLTHCFIRGVANCGDELLADREDLAMLAYPKNERSPSGGKDIPNISLKGKMQSPVLRRSQKQRTNIFFSKSIVISPKLSTRESLRPVSINSVLN